MQAEVEEGWALNVTKMCRSRDTIATSEYDEPSKIEAAITMLLRIPSGSSTPESILVTHIRRQPRIQYLQNNNFHPPRSDTSPPPKTIKNRATNEPLLTTLITTGRGKRKWLSSVLLLLLLHSSCWTNMHDPARAPSEERLTVWKGVCFDAWSCSHTFYQHLFLWDVWRSMIWHVRTEHAHEHEMKLEIK